jgi:signal transduction histidine kinase
MKNKVAALLGLTLLVMSLLPLGAALFMVKVISSSQEQIYKSSALGRVLNETQEQMKVFSKINPAGEQTYRSLFREIQDLKLIYGDDRFFAEQLDRSLFKYFLLGFGAVLVVSIVLGVLLARAISLIYRKSYDELESARIRSRELEELARWQEVAKTLAHELKGPLQPIGTWISTMRTAFSPKATDSFAPILFEACRAIEEEVKSLKGMVGEFANFANLPKARLQSVEIDQFLRDFSTHYEGVWPSVKIVLKTHCSDIFCSIDSFLFRRALGNIIENAAQANPGQAIEFSMASEIQGKNIVLNIFNSGVALNKEQMHKIFDPYYTTKGKSKNMGLGMAIVKLTVLDHGGSIEVEPESQGVRFKIALPIRVGDPDVTNAI